MLRWYMRPAGLVVGHISGNSQPVTSVGAAVGNRLTLAGKKRTTVNVESGPSETVGCEGLFDAFGIELVNGETISTVVRDLQSPSAEGHSAKNPVELEFTVTDIPMPDHFALHDFFGR